ncbi:MAG: hypothetical protein PW845_01410 [Pseudomonas sp.]|nr:hypothetical protein [Pseudomonas sp.]
MKQFFNKPYLLPTLVSLALLVALTLALTPTTLSLATLAQDVRWLVLLAVFLYCLFCWACIGLARWGEVAWKRVDYLWLGLAALALMVQTSLGDSIQALATPLLLVVALAVRAAKVKAEVLFKTPRRKTVWLVLNQRLEIPVEERLDMRLQRAKVRLVQLLKDWRIGQLPLAHVEVGLPSKGPAPLASAVIAVKPRFQEPEFSYDFQQSLETTALGQWILEQPVDSIYLFGEINATLLAQLFRWGKAHQLEVIVDGGVTLMTEEAAIA